MNTGQTMMVIIALVLLGTLALTVNSTIVDSSEVSLEMEAGLDALSYGQSLMDEILDKEYDEATTDGQRVFSYSQLTPPSALGPESGELTVSPDSSATSTFKSAKGYDDVDDYNGYTRKVLNSRLDVFTLTVRVKYVSEDVPDSTSSTQTFYKRISVTVTNPYMTKDASGTVTPLVMRDLSIYRRYF